MKLLKIYCLLLFSSILSIIHVHSARILGIFPHPLKSRFNVNNAIMRSLVSAGHQVVVFAPFSVANLPENYTLVDTSKGLVHDVGVASVYQYKDMTTHAFYKVITEYEVQMFTLVLSMSEMQHILNSEKKLFDVLFVEIAAMYKTFWPIAQKWNIPVISTVTTRTSLYADNFAGNPNNPSFVPFENAARWSGRGGNFYERFANTMHHLIAHTLWYKEVAPSMRQFYGKHFPALISNVDNADLRPSLVFYNSHFTFIPRPMNPNVIEIGGIHVVKEKPLPSDLEKFISEAEHGVILFTFGTVVLPSTLQKEIKEAFIKVFAKIPQRVIWKFDDRTEKISDNVLVTDWIPQRDVLAHKNVKAFVTHCGLSGTYEAIYTGTPVVGIPLFFDQMSNADLLVSFGAAVRLELDSINEGDFAGALNAVINDTRYQESMKKLSARFRDRKMSAQESVVYWTEYIIKHGGAPHLRTAATQLHWLQYFLLDIILFVLSSLSVILYSIYFVFKFYRTRFRRENDRNTLLKKSD